MALVLDDNHRTEIDREIWNIYGQRLGGSELRQLARLFQGTGLPARLSKIFAATLPKPTPNYRVDLEIKVAWIDKRPLAKPVNQSKRGELGDAAFFYIEFLQNRGKLVALGARALIMQAKAAKEAKQMAGPTVPVNPSRPSPGSSTERELSLLSRWETFDLFATSASKKPIAEDISVMPPTLPPAYGWYMATPRRHPEVPVAKAWASPWMCGPAEPNASCVVTLGQLLTSFFTFAAHAGGGTNLPAAGENFKFDQTHMTEPVGNGWDRLCVEILRLCPNYQLPQSLFGTTRKQGSVDTSRLRSFPYLGGDGGHPTLQSRVWEWLFPRRMPVLVVVLTKIE